MASSYDNDVSKEYGQPSGLLSLANVFEKIVLFFAYVFCWAYPILVFAILINVVLRYGFSSGLIVFEEIQWHLYAIGMLFGLAYAEITNSQVKVDVLAANFKKKTTCLWEIFGVVCLVLPFLFVVIFNSIEYVQGSYAVNESSNSPLGLPYRWAIKSVIPLSFVFLLLAVIARLLRNINLLFNNKREG